MAATSRPTSSASSASIASSTASLPARGVGDWKYLLDFNEGCPNVGYLLDCLRRVREATPAGFDRILYIEQPTARDLKKDRANVMHEAARLRPVVIDESLTDLETLLLAREMGYTGVALKACKGQTHAMLMAAAAQKFGMFLCVQDLTCPGASLIHSAGIAARVPGNAGIEANARQFVPARQRAVGSALPGAVHDPRRRDEDGPADRPWARRGPAASFGWLGTPGACRRARRRGSHADETRVDAGRRAGADGCGRRRPPARRARGRIAAFCLFSKHLPELNWADLGRAVKDAVSRAWT